MILSAIYIKEYYLFEEPQIINLGGRFIYSLENNFISRKGNENYIANFYCENVISQVSAIVGRNGAGKSSLLNMLIEVLNNEYGLQSALIFEKDNDVLIRNRSRVQFGFEFETFSNNAITLYYSPYLDFKSDRNGFDLSLDNTIEKDLENINDIRKGNENVEPLQHLKMRNSIRQMDFTNSDIGGKFVELFDLPANHLNKITFTRYMIDVDRETDKIQFHNTPYGFRDELQFIYEKIKKEANEINNNRPKGYSLVKLQKDLLKNYFLMDFICLFIIQMERSNDYLGEGFLKREKRDFIKENYNSSAFEAFYDFLDDHCYKMSSDEFTLLPIQETKDLIEKVYSFIDAAEAVDDRDNKNFEWNYKAIYLEHNKAIELLELQNRFLNVVEEYYSNKTEKIDELINVRFSKIKDFINFQPSERNLSSGENAMLNLFSRFHEVFKDFTKKTIDTVNFVLLDEADLGFHPQWKKKYVSTILEFFSMYFNDFNSNVQIIFTTHDPLTLSDILNYNVVYLDKSNNQIVLNDESRPIESFGANINDLLASSFFVNNGLIGDFAMNKIQNIIDYINIKEKRSEIEWISSPNIALKVINQIGEPYLNDKLNDMFMEAFPEYKDDEIKRLEEKLNQLKNDSNY
ncbi:ATP-binding cassette domain-containing protein [Chryseobacterium sp. ERMR1:04]|uniref:AAA family ATPase n=1 Tax=Chryseobacterium sp. ERMR1:04 TaxID=1705393 RepID=UPI0006C86A8D|nr:ATP-binding cassette domain-containing protein [Chryseobacterium sp. ERMR1:04]KPH15180.1 hypothetical protein AMQ68_07255 [Chryseobacterium sp. ERMR1:04]